MNTILSIIVMLVVCRLLLKYTWIGKTILLVFKTLGEMCKFLYNSVLWVNEKICKMNSKMHHEESAHDASENKVIDLKKRTKQAK
jgi:cell division protein FtsL